jgi:hypothetical protein
MTSMHSGTSATHSSWSMHSYAGPATNTYGQAMAWSHPHPPPWQRRLTVISLPKVYVLHTSLPGAAWPCAKLIWKSRLPLKKKSLPDGYRLVIFQVENRSTIDMVRRMESVPFAGKSSRLTISFSHAFLQNLCGAGWGICLTFSGNLALLPSSFRIYNKHRAAVWTLFAP